MGKKKFLDKKKGTTFVLMHRGGDAGPTEQTDAASKDAFVLAPIESVRAAPQWGHAGAVGGAGREDDDEDYEDYDEGDYDDEYEDETAAAALRQFEDGDAELKEMDRKAFNLPDDGYDYSKHLRYPGKGTFLSALQAPVMRADVEMQVTKRALRDVSEMEEEMRALQKSITVPPPKKDKKKQPQQQAKPAVAAAAAAAAKPGAAAAAAVVGKKQVADAEEDEDWEEEDDAEDDEDLDELEDDFIALAQGGMLEVTPRIWKDHALGGGGGGGGGGLFDGELIKGTFPVGSGGGAAQLDDAAQALLEERFEEMMRQYEDGDDDEDEYSDDDHPPAHSRKPAAAGQFDDDEEDEDDEERGDEDDEDGASTAGADRHRTIRNAMVQNALNDFMKKRKADKKLPTSKPEKDAFLTADGVRRELLESDSEDDKKMEEASDEEDEEDHWDCETILTTYTNTENHPTFLEPAQRRRIKLGKDGIPKAGLPERKPLPVKEEEEEEEEGDKVNKGEKRKDGETAEEKKARKAAVKQEKQERRAAKAALSQAWKEATPKPQPGKGMSVRRLH